jgi:anthranilate synthase/aminodeoxychorismate synthase-like glutamine amidotransferase
MIFIVDNYDSFTYNLVQALGKLDPEVEVSRNDCFDPESICARRPDAIVISPGPGRPEGAGQTLPLIACAERERIPLLGVCLGHQAIAHLHGGVVERAPAPRHGKSSTVFHDGTGLFAGLSNPFEAARYHSLIVREEGLPEESVLVFLDPVHDTERKLKGVARLSIGFSPATAGASRIHKFGEFAS